MTDAFAIKAEKNRVEIAPAMTDNFQLTVTNLTDSDIRTRLQLVGEEAGATDWLRIVGTEVRDLAPGRETLVEIAAHVPERTAPTSRAVRLLASSQADPENVVSEGPRLVVDVVEGVNARIPWWRQHWLKLVVAGAVAIVLALLLSSYKQIGLWLNPPTPAVAVAKFEPTPSEGTAPLSVAFKNQSEHAESYKWEFGDGSTSVEAAPSHKFDTPGSFTVKLTATGKGGNAESSMKINVGAPAPVAPKPVAKFDATPSVGVAPLPVTFTNHSQHAESYVWNFGDGSRTSTEAQPRHRFKAPGSYTVKLAVTGKGGSAEFSMTIAATSCAARVHKHEPGNDAFVEFQLPTAAHGTQKDWNDGFFTQYKFPTCRGLGWKNIKFVCNNGKWITRPPPEYYTNVLCHGTTSAQPGMRTGLR